MVPANLSTDLVWLHEEEEPREPTPPVIEEPPPPTPSPPPVPEIKEDPYERRLRKAKGVCVSVHSCMAYLFTG